MLVLALSKRGFILLQLLLQLSGSFATLPSSLEPGSFQINYLNNFIQNVYEEKFAETLLILRRGQDVNCVLKEFNSHHLIPTLRHDESTIISVRDHFNSEAIALVCMSELADSMLLTSLAKDLHRMRETRVIIWLQTLQSTLNAFLKIITDQSSNHNFLSLIVLHSNSSDVNGSFVAYRLYPFPSPTIVRILDLYNGTIFPKFWTNFWNKTAVAIPNINPPASFLSQDKRSGKTILTGFLDKLMREFAIERNINLRIKEVDSAKSINDEDIVNMTLSGEIDLSMHGRAWRSYLESTYFVGLSDLFIVVPCGEEMTIENVYRALRSGFLIVLGVYFLFSIVETLFMAANSRIFGKSYRFCYTSFFINLSALSVVLGLPIKLNRNMKRVSSIRFIVILMSICSLIVLCFLNANLSTLLTKRPQQNHITSFEQLRDSGIPIIFGSIYRKFLLDELKKRNIIFQKHQIVFKPNKERYPMVWNHNSSTAFQLFSLYWESYNKYQKLYNRKALCKSEKLIILDSFSYHCVLKHNSVYKQALNEFIYYCHEFGYFKHWTEESMQTIFTFSPRRQFTSGPASLKYEDLQWLWKLILLLYLTSILIFIGEKGFAYWQWKRRPKFDYVA